MNWRQAMIWCLQGSAFDIRTARDANGDDHWVAIDAKIDAPKIESESVEIAPFSRAGEPYSQGDQVCFNAE
jgi:hypothetical protein